MIAAPNERSDEYLRKADGLGLLLEPLKLFGLQVFDDWEVLFRRPHVLARRKNIDSNVSCIPHQGDDFFVFLAEAEHDPGLYRRL